jgi:hypothetical protein
MGRRNSFFIGNSSGDGDLRLVRHESKRRRWGLGRPDIKSLNSCAHMLQEDQSIVANHCDVVEASLLGVQDDPYSTILKMRDDAR